jgi:hypothetical protein
VEAVVFCSLRAGATMMLRSALGLLALAFTPTDAEHRTPERLAVRPSAVIVVVSLSLSAVPSNRAPPVATDLTSACFRPRDRAPTQAITELKNKLHTLTAEEATQAFKDLAEVHQLKQPPPRQQKIDQ